MPALLTAYSTSLSHLVRPYICILLCGVLLLYLLVTILNHQLIDVIPTLFGVLACSLYLLHLLTFRLVVMTNVAADINCVAAIVVMASHLSPPTSGLTPLLVPDDITVPYTVTCCVAVWFFPTLTVLCLYYSVVICWPALYSQPSPASAGLV